VTGVQTCALPIWEKRNAYKILVGNPEGKRPLGRPSVGGWTILKWILERHDGMVWIGSIRLKNALVNAVMNLRVP
jgi:hypothetical protein